MTDTTPTYKPGDVANGHVLTETGQWLPIGGPPPTGPSPKAKKPIWTRWWMILVYVFVGLMVIVAMTSGGGTPADEDPANASTTPKADGQVENSTDPQPVDTGNDDPANDLSQIGNWHLVGKPKVDNVFDTYDLTLRVQNTGDEVDQAFIDATFLDKKDNILGTAICTSADVNPGQITTLSCLSGDDYNKNWATIEYQNSF